ncbi:autotransporter outer membrane beta-barrel domain-containing protein [Ancylobacter lacus]|uniref:autotransporter outer membrane beta-barrel domain-containing protein n=1 Tax=Ancylobacter lacus TaxID=2579970 RepID=UPI001BCBA64A|nr:autotransporter outer membrane beta-barrel domain-containing protein [Ancylobacter lacus]MBS7539325.1 autotransporter outer membrane beta-barrel domain-containing protein [Ancylobacter lacus]
MGLSVAMLFGPTPASAQCDFNSSTATTNVTRNCVSLFTATTNVAGGAAVSGRGTSTTGGVGAVVNNAGSIANANGTGNVNAVDILAAGSASYSGGGRVTSTNGDGINIQGSTTSVTVTGGTIEGGDDAVTANALVRASVTGTGATFLGGNDGLDLSAGGSTQVNQTGGAVTGTSGNGISAVSADNGITLADTTVQGGLNGITTGGGATTLDLTGGTVRGISGDGIHVRGLGGLDVTATDTVVTGGDDGIDLLGPTVDLTLTGGGVTGAGGDGISATALGVLGLGGTARVTTSGTTVTGAQNGLAASAFGLDTATSVEVVVNGGSIAGNDGFGVAAMAVSGSLAGTPQDATASIAGSGVITGSDAGAVAIAASVGGDPSAFDPQDPSSWLLGDGRATVSVDTRGDVTGTAGSGILALALGNGGNSVSVDTTGGRVEGQGGFGVLAGSIDNGGVGGNTVEVVTGDVFGTAGGVLGFNTNGDASVAANGRIEVAGGGLIGVGALAANGGSASAVLDGIIDPPLIGVGALALGAGTASATTSATSSVDADLIGVIALNVGDGRAVVDNGGEVFSSSGALPLLGFGAVKIGDASASADPDVVVTNAGDISDFAVGALGLGIGGGNDVAVDNSGDIRNAFVGIAGVAISTAAGGAVRVDNAGSLSDVAGIGVLGLAVGDGSTVEVGNTGSVSAGWAGIAGVLVGDGGALDIRTQGAVAATDGLGVLGLAVGSGNTLDILADAAVEGRYLGVGALSIGDANALALVTSGAVSSAEGAGVAAIGLGGDGVLEVTTNGAVSGNVLGVAALQIGDGAAVDVVANGAVSAAGGVGVLASAIGAGGTVTVTANSAVTAGLAGVVGVNLGGDATVTSTGKVSVDGGYVGVGALAVGGNASVTINGAIDPPAVGGAAVTIGSGTATLDANAVVQATTLGLLGANVGSGAVVINVNAGGAVQSDGVGVLAVKAGPGNVSVEVDGAVGGLGTVATGDDGILAFALGDGLVSISTTGNGIINAGDDGISINKAGNGAGADAVIVSATGAIVAAGDGIDIDQLGGDGNITVTTRGAIAAGANGVIADKQSGAGTINLFLDNDIAAGASAVVAEGSGQDGDVVVGTGFGTTLTAGATGILAAKTDGGAGTIAVTTGFFSQIVAGGTGISASNLIGAGSDVFVATGLESIVAANADGILAAGTGMVGLTVSDFATVRGDLDQNGVGSALRIVSAETATVNVGNGAIVSGSGQSAADAVISVASEAGASITIGAGARVTAWTADGSGSANNDVVAAAGALALNATGGPVVVANDGTLYGLVALSGGDDSFGNASSGNWASVGANDFGVGSDTLANAGRLVTALRGGVAESTGFSGLESFVNGDPSGVGAGTLTMIDGDTLSSAATRDRTYVSGTFAGQGNSTLGVDAWLGGPGSTSDQLVVGGLDAGGNPVSGAATSGVTSLYVNDVNARGAGAYNPGGILVVAVQNGQTQAGDFVLSSSSPNYSSTFGGVIDKGLFFYDLAVQPNPDGGLGQYLVGLPDQEAFELPMFITGAQTIWYETSGVWLDRQADLRSYLMAPQPVGPATTLVTKEQGLVTKAPPRAVPDSVTPGVWGKAIGSWASWDSTSSYSGAGSTGYSFDTGYDQDTYGFIAGADFGKTAGDSAFIFGVMGGYVASSLDFNSSATSGDYSGGTVGVYATYLKGGFFVDGLFKADILELDYSVPSLGPVGYSGETTDVTSLGFTIDTGYRFTLQETYFIEPVATLSYVSTRIDDLNGLEGTIVRFNDGESLRGSLGGRLGGRVYENDRYWLEASLTGRLWYEFEGDNSVTISNPGSPFTSTDDFDGAFGEVGARINWFGKGTGWNGFVNGSVTFNGDYTSGTALTGVRYQW